MTGLFARRKSASPSGFFISRVPISVALCLCGILLSMFSFAATPLVKATRANTGRPLASADFRSAGGYSLPAVPLSPDATPTPDPFDLPQVTAEAPPCVPATASCMEEVLSHTFVNSSYARLWTAPGGDMSWPVGGGYPQHRRECKRCAI